MIQKLQWYFLGWLYNLCKLGQVSTSTFTRWQHWTTNSQHVVCVVKVLFLFFMLSKVLLLMATANKNKHPMFLLHSFYPKAALMAGSHLGYYLLFVVHCAICFCQKVSLGLLHGALMTTPSW